MNTTKNNKSQEGRPLAVRILIVWCPVVSCTHFPALSVWDTEMHLVRGSGSQTQSLWLLLLHSHSRRRPPGNSRSRGTGGGTNRPSFPLLQSVCPSMSPLQEYKAERVIWPLVWPFPVPVLLTQRHNVVYGRHN